ncbi:OLC1v1025069C1 [Oldenlandia corymbosa var. corymbosa]|uniref:OLC1v1025069C1 n=1 Tax=Oldenlandia corymbosa var. corymbosa TaxID=529605 RepID=A0AAV1C3V6_OLDCO|nr:OLC1v1025069C1 [Oldenlandia corymbosa var. corymbosa]
MKYFKENPSSHHLPSRIVNFIVISCSIFGIYLLLSLVLVPDANQLHLSATALQNLSSTTSLEHIVFGIASTRTSWLRRKEYVRLWWKPGVMKGCVFLEQMPPNTSLSLEKDRVSLTPLCVSEDTSRFPYTFKGGLRSAIRVARVVSETVALNYSNVRWFVFGDDDTVFFPENLVKTLRKYDHGLWYYIGTNSENFEANKAFSFEMAFGGAGFAISYPLAKVLAKVLDSCLERYHHLYGSDSRIYSCLTELGVSLTHEPGFHQASIMDVRGSIFGLLTVHPVKPLATLHHLDAIDPIFPNKTTLGALRHLFDAAKVDSERILQQTVCYDRLLSRTISVSWGYAIQLMESNILLPDVVRAQETFRAWKKGQNNHIINAQRSHPDSCSRPAVFFFDSAFAGRDGITSIYKIMDSNSSNCTNNKKKDEIRVFSKKLDLDIRQLQASRRQCCDVLNSSAQNLVEIGIRECGAEELIAQMVP